MPGTTRHRPLYELRLYAAGPQGRSSQPTDRTAMVTELLPDIPTRKSLVHIIHIPLLSSNMTMTALSWAMQPLLPDHDQYP